ncbi:MAG: hypothetical protein ACYCQN_10650 [Acidiferrobacteraceae bacterium]
MGLKTTMTNAESTRVVCSCTPGCRKPPVGIRRLACGAVALLLACTPAFAAPGPKTPALTLAYDRTPAVCHYLLNLYNHDVSRYGYVDTRTHAVFTAIHWTPLPDHPPVGTQHTALDAEIAFFDINNAGRVLPVVRFRGSMGNVLADGLAVLKVAPISVQQVNRWMQDPRKHIWATFPLRSIGYPLKHAPARFTSTRTRPPSLPILPPVGLALHPLRYQGTVYLSASFNAEPGEIGIGREFGRWIVVGKFRPNDTFEDVCYFREGAFRPAQRK